MKRLQTKALEAAEGGSVVIDSSTNDPSVTEGNDSVDTLSANFRHRGGTAKSGHDMTSQKHVESNGEGE